VKWGLKLRLIFTGATVFISRGIVKVYDATKELGLSLVSQTKNHGDYSFNTNSLQIICIDFALYCKCIWQIFANMYEDIRTQ